MAWGGGGGIGLAHNYFSTRIFTARMHAFNLRVLIASLGSLLQLLKYLKIISVETIEILFTADGIMTTLTSKLFPLALLPCNVEM